MNKTIIPIIVSFILAAPAIAQVPGYGKVREQIRDTKENVRQEIKETRKNAREEIKDARQNVKEDIREVRQAAKEEIKQLEKTEFEAFKAKREQLKVTIEQKREEFKKTVETKRETLKETVKAKREDLKKRLTGIKDEKKRQTVEKIDQRLDALNEKTLNHFSAVLDKLEKVLERIGSRADKAEAHGRDVSSVKTLINEAKTAIANVRTAISEQTGKTYVIVISAAATTTPNGTLRSDVGKTRQALHADLVKVRERVFAAREAVRKVAVALAQIPKVDELEVEEATSTPPTTTSTSTVPSIQ